MHKYIVLSLISLFTLSGCNSSPSVTPEEDKSLLSISLSGNYPTEFMEGSTFSYDGLIVTASYSDNTSSVVNDYVVSSPDMYNIGTQSVNVTYTYKEVSKSSSYSINISKKEVEDSLTSISLSGSYPTEFYYGDSFSYTGLVVTAHYQNGTSKVVTGYLVNRKDDVVTVSYTEKEITKEATYNVTFHNELRSVMNETLIGRQYYLNHIGDIFSTWKEYRGRGVTIAVIDSGFDTTHEEFVNVDGTSKISEYSAYIKNTNGTISTQVGVNYVHDLSDSHGTFCAGVAAAALNGKGVIGVAPMAELLLLRVDKKPKSIAEAFKYAADHGAKVITISIGSYYDYEGDLVNDGSDLSKVFDDAVAYARSKGVVICSAAGNGGGYRPTEYTYPGAVNNIIGCGGLASNSNGEVWSGSSYNSSPQYQFVDVFAPSENMYNICNYMNGSTRVTYDGGWEGTSFSSPIVAGLAALYFEKYPTRNVINFENDLYSSCHKITTAYIDSSHLGYGRVDVSALLGIKNSDTVTLTVSTNWSNTYLYAWNSDISLEKEIASWPGVKIASQPGATTYNIKLSDYDCVIFNDGNTRKSVDLLASSFIDGSAYYISSTSPTESGAYVGSYGWFY